MKNRNSRILIFTCLVMVGIIGCDIPYLMTSVPTVEPGLVSTYVAQTLMAVSLEAPPPSMTPPAPSDTPPPTFTETSTITFTPTFTETPSLTPSATITASATMSPTSEKVTVHVVVDTNCRSGPGKIYDYLGALLTGETTDVYARDPLGEYWYVRNPDNPGGYCWLWGHYATPVGYYAALPIYTPPATPTSAPAFDLSYAKVQKCVGWFFDLKAKNTGSIPFKSYSTTLKDKTNNKTVNSSSNVFEELSGCLSAGSLDEIASGQVGHVNSGNFLYNPSGHKINATVTLCTKDGLSGMCISETIEFKP